MTLGIQVSFSRIQEHKSTEKENTTFYTFDFDIDPITLTLKLELKMVKMNLYTKNEVPSYSNSRLIAWTDRRTDTTEIITYRCTRMVINCKQCLHVMFVWQVEVWRR